MSVAVSLDSREPFPPRGTVFTSRDPTSHSAIRSMYPRRRMQDTEHYYVARSTKPRPIKYRHSFLSNFVLICTSIKPTLLGPRALCPRNPAQAEHLQSHLLVPLSLQACPFRQIPRHSPAGSVYPIQTRARIDGRSWKSSTACEPPGKSCQVSRRCDILIPVLKSGGRCGFTHDRCRRLPERREILLDRSDIRNHSPPSGWYLHQVISSTFFRPFRFSL